MKRQLNFLKENIGEALPWFIAWLLIVLFLVIVNSCRGDDVAFPLQNFTSTSVTNRKVLVTPLSLYPGVSQVASYDPIMYTATNGSFIVSNMIKGLYRADIQAPPSKTSFSFFVATNGTGGPLVTVDSIQRATPAEVKTPQDYAYSAQASDARYFLKAGNVDGVVTNGQTNPTFNTMRVNAPSDTNGLAIYGPPGLIWLVSGANIYGYDGVNEDGTPHVAVSIDSVGDYVTEVGDVQAYRFYGSGVGLTNLNATNALSGTIPLANLPTNLQTGSQNLTNWSGRPTNSFVASLGGSSTNQVFRDTNSSAYILITNRLYRGVSTQGGSNGLSLYVIGVGQNFATGPAYYEYAVMDVYGNVYSEVYNPTHDVFINGSTTNYGMEMQVAMSGGYAFSTAYGYGPGSTNYSRNRRAWQWGIGGYGQPYAYRQAGLIPHTDNTNLFDAMYPMYYIARVYTNVNQAVSAGSLSSVGSFPLPAEFFSAYDTTGAGWWRWFDAMNDCDDSGNYTFPGTPRFAIITGPSTNAGIQVSGAIRVNGLQGITTNKIINGEVWQFTSGLLTSCGPIDSDLTAFFTRMGSVSLAVTNAMITFVSTLKAAGTWTNLDFLYPMVGANIGSNCFNLISTNYTGVPHGSFTTADATGIKSDGSSGYIDTGYRTTNQNSSGLFVYLSADSSGYGTRTPIGANATAYSWIGHANTAFWYASINEVGGGVTLVTPSFPASMLIERNGANVEISYVNGVAGPTTTTASTTPPAQNVFICARNGSGTATDYFDGKIQIAAGLRSALSAPQAATLHNACVALNTALGR